MLLLGQLFCKGLATLEGIQDAKLLELGGGNSLDMTLFAKMIGKVAVSQTATKKVGLCEDVIGCDRMFRGRVF